MSTLVRSNGNHGYELVVTIDGKETVTPIIDIVDDGKTLKLPANDCNRQYYSIAKVEAAPNKTIELTYKETKTFGPRLASATPKAAKDLSDYLEGIDKEDYLELTKKAKKAKEEATKKVPLTDLQKAEAALRRYEAQVEKLKAAQAARENGPVVIINPGTSIAKEVPADTLMGTVEERIAVLKNLPIEYIEKKAAEYRATAKKSKK